MSSDLFRHFFPVLIDCLGLLGFWILFRNAVGPNFMKALDAKFRQSIRQRWASAKGL